MSVQRGEGKVVLSTPLPGLLLVMFIGFKLAGIIDWSWLWVLAPLWIGFAVALCFGLIAAVLLGIAGCIDVAAQNKRIRRRRKQRTEDNRIHLGGRY